MILGDTVFSLQSAPLYPTADTLSLLYSQFVLYRIKNLIMPEIITTGARKDNNTMTTSPTQTTPGPLPTPRRRSSADTWASVAAAQWNRQMGASLGGNSLRK